MPVDKDLLEILACPADRQPLREEPDRLVCTACGRRYPVRDGIPVMLVEEAEQPATGRNESAMDS
ncbi:MAG TPA: Trm112 family protein [Candidatus Limnocylindria bacterium]|nr:Trm112 family protein [Candidatus Limnocylindria bacterium]